MGRVFVSHASADAALTNEFVDKILRSGCGLKDKQFFYSSDPRTGVANGKSVMETVRRELSESDLVVVIVSSTYQSRPVCLAELGAAWARAGV